MKFNNSLKISFGSAILLCLSILIDQLLDKGCIIHENLPEIANVVLYFFNIYTFKIIVALAFATAISIITGVIQYIMKCGEGEIV
ncbi:MAG: hypothetical protein US83_C0011G0008 [Candidatus Falkowbacteria bacterium GW2011_GWC2_38_22]|uniref:Uncharacterized protein n=1 Tax=Candidatus Falkowbacteria bacterium GW2011_GWE1_38_31 TaxID=1618638 RepID=A0A0G0K2W8_9BACT|nr:MAG: hypothetical protein US73_C0009G0008 [Candidatus Falkowbacteria bacterium GW2011_GWF2_38_1205]KKQ60890.1 MAG: hypothetical protein US83_C0011G0008 [Candidatus Falkowbacteria bacterium GW2011_GWC2_38_22]KKQ63008.1 MAG: hypothetical protein US84_C0009G0008 [Candidatus Falkowbacteria bacterium GW2011_GWF1_38_22]KKQ65030.1 MAG: hypothetical protein US87_C0009G0008 [Candidatus Falkowbacteria bacterium GW2011_GWE2_38_254]KKQ69805.1 MAG: hypothetical protein US91_C0009G0008 [Candidatus Falkowb